MTDAMVDFEQSMDRLIKEANAGPEYVAVLRAAAEQSGAFSGMAAADVANAFADLLSAPRRHEEELRRTNQLWSGLFPDVAALGDNSPYVSVRHMIDGDLVWSWVSRGQRRWQPGWVTR